MLEPDEQLKSMFETAIMLAIDNKHEYLTLEYGHVRTWEINSAVTS